MKDYLKEVKEYLGITTTFICLTEDLLDGIHTYLNDLYDHIVAVDEINADRGMSAYCSGYDYYEALSDYEYKEKIEILRTMLGEYIPVLQSQTFIDPFINEEELPF